MWRVNPLLLRGLQTLNTARRQPRTATSRRPYPRIPLCLIWAYMHRHGCTPRRGGGRIASPAAHPPDQGKALNGRAPGELEVEAASESRGKRPRHTRFPCNSAARSPSAQVIAEQADYNSRLQVQREAIQVDPQGRRRNDCVNAGRNPHHFPVIAPCRNAVTQSEAVTVRPGAHSLPSPRQGAGGSRAYECV